MAESDKSEQEKQESIKQFLADRSKLLKSQLEQKVGPYVITFLDEEQRRLLVTSILLADIIENYGKDTSIEVMRPVDFALICTDHSFIAHPASKAFEGYIKKLLIKLHLISKREIKKNPFTQVGRIINSPEFEKKVKDKRLRHVPKELQVEWDKSRNYLSHYDLDKPRQMSVADAKVRIDAMCKIMKESYEAFCASSKI